MDARKSRQNDCPTTPHPTERERGSERVSEWVNDRDKEETETRTEREREKERESETEKRKRETQRDTIGRERERKRADGETVKKKHGEKDRK